MSTIRARRRGHSLRAPAALLLVVALTAAACGGDDDDSTSSGGGGGGKSVKIALLLPETKTVVQADDIVYVAATSGSVGEAVALAGKPPASED